MKPTLSTCYLPYYALVFCTAIASQTNSAFAQDSNIVPDDTLGAESSTVNPRDETSDSIQGGAIRGQNLFHSFEEFNIGEGRGAYFANPDAVDNIFSRVTGSNPSNILGTLGVDGAADLYLVNPNGIIFGENSSLDVQGSFTATTAEAIEFGEGGLFSAVTPGESLLTISVPLGLQFGSTPGSIVNRSFVQDETGDFVGLQVPTKKNLTLVGGEIRFEKGQATARGGNIYLGGLAQEGMVGFNEDRTLSFSQDVVLSNITLTNAADIDVTGMGGGSININAQNLKLEAGEFGSSFIRGGIAPDSISEEVQSGDIAISVTRNITLDESYIENQVFGIGNSGSIDLRTDSLDLINGGAIDASTFGQGNAGAINITADGDITADGENSNGLSSGISSQVGLNSIGNSENITISTSSLNLINGGRVDASTFGQGDTGVINITAAGDITADGENSNGFSSGISSQVNQDASGNAKGITISTNNLKLRNGGVIDSSIFGQGDTGVINITAAGDITADGESSEGFPSGISSLVFPSVLENSGGIKISSSNLILSAGGRVSSSTFGQGNAGAINITATGDITADGEDSNGFRSGITSQVNLGATGNSEGIKISSNNLILLAGAQVSAGTSGQGDAGTINITANGDVTADGENFNGVPSGIIGQVNQNAIGNGGAITISTNNLKLTNGARVDSSTVGVGNAGLINIIVTGNTTADGEDSNGFPSGIISGVSIGAVGNARGITISTNNLQLTNGGRIVSATLGQGDAGATNITATENIIVDGKNSLGFVSVISSGVNTSSVGNAEELTISTNNLQLTNGGRVSASTLGQGNAGELMITANSVNLSRESSIASASESSFNAGDIIFNVIDSLQATDSIISTSSTQSSGGNLSITSGNIQLRGDSDIITNIASGGGSGGNITVEADSIIAFDDSDIFAFAANGQGGNINLDTPAFFAENFTLNSLTADPDNLDLNNRADLNATGAVSSGAVEIPDVSFIQNGLTELTDNSIDTNELVANSCVAPAGERSQGKFIITGRESLPIRPGNNLPSRFSTGEVRGASADSSTWQPGDPIVEPQGVYRLANGKLVLSRECSQ